VTCLSNQSAEGSLAQYPESSDAPYDRLADRVIEWCRAHPKPLPHMHNPDMQL